MPRRRVQGTAGVVFHVINRGVRRAPIFDRDGDYRDFLYLLIERHDPTRISLFAYCLMPNHFHFLLRPAVDGAMSEFIARLTLSHTKRWHASHGTSGTGPLYQGRFKAFPVASDHHFLTVCRYVERNPLRAELVKRAEAWPWSSLAQRLRDEDSVALAGWPVDRPSGWPDLVNLQEPPAETEVVRRAVRRSRPFGADGWSAQMATWLALKPSLRPVGRPRKIPGIIFPG